MSNEKTEGVSPHVLPPLPYSDSALAPVISANTIGFHWSSPDFVDTLNCTCVSVSGGIQTPPAL